jgi:hypothetical protein
MAKDNATTDPCNLHWTEAVTEEVLLEKLMDTINNTLEEHKGRLNNVRTNLKLYEDSESGIRGGSTLECRVAQLGNDDREMIDGHGYNVVRVCVNTLTNKIGKNKINPRILITGAPFIVREKAKKADTFLKAVFKKLDIRKHAKTALYDACLHGTGILKVCNDGHDVWIERAMPDEVFVEIADGYRGNPDRAYEVRYVSRRTIMEMTEDNVKQANIMEATSVPFPSASTRIQSINSVSTGTQKDENIMVFEAWQKASGDNPGRHVIAVSNCIILDEEWDRDYLPFVKIDYNDPLIGWYATGIAHELHYAQKDLVEMDNLINESIISMTAPKILVNGDADIRTEEFDNMPGRIIRIGGIAPGTALQTVVSTLTPQAISSEVYSYREGKIKDAHDQSGISQMSAGGYKPVGLDSGAALREFNDIQTERFVLLGQAWENAHKQAAEYLFKEMLRDGGNYTVRTRQGSSLKAIKLSDLNLDIDDVEVSIYPVSSLPDSPAGRLQTVNEWVASGLIDPSDAAELLDMPDLESYNELRNAPKRAVDRLIDRVMADPFKTLVVNPYMDLEYLISRCMLFYNYVLAETDDATFDEYTSGEEIAEDMGEIIAGEDQEEVRRSGSHTPIEIANQLLDTFIRITEEAKAVLEEELASVEAPPMPPAADPAMGGMGMPQEQMPMPMPPMM